MCSFSDLFLKNFVFFFKWGYCFNRHREELNALLRKQQNEIRNYCLMKATSMINSLVSLSLYKKLIFYVY